MCISSRKKNKLDDNCKIIDNYLFFICLMFTFDSFTLVIEKTKSYFGCQKDLLCTSTNFKNCLFKTITKKGK